MQLHTEAPRPSRRTVPPPERPGFERAEVVFRRVAAGAMALLVAAGLTGFLGPAERTVTTGGAAGELAVTHPSVTRPGLDSEVEIAVRGAARPTEPFRVALPSDAMAGLGLEVVDPEPTAESVEGGDVVLQFDPAVAGPDGVLVVTLSGRMPTKQLPGRQRWHVEWRGPGGTLRVPLTTWVLP